MLRVHALTSSKQCALLNLHREDKIRRLQHFKVSYEREFTKHQRTVKAFQKEIHAHGQTAIERNTAVKSLQNERQAHNRTAVQHSTVINEVAKARAEVAIAKRQLANQVSRSNTLAAQVAHTHKIVVSHAHGSIEW